MSRESELHEELYEAVFAGDLAKAEQTLVFMQGAGINSEAVRRARRKARPEMRLASQMEHPLVLPQPGAHPHDVFGAGGKRYAREGYAAPKRASRRRARG